MKDRIKGNMNRKILCCAGCITPFIVLFILTKTTFPKAYLFEWMLRRHYLLIWLLAGIIAFVKPMVAGIISASDTVAIIVGQTLGDWLHARNIEKIEASMSEEQKAMLHIHPGFAIWLYSFVGLLILSMILYAVIKHMRHVTDGEQNES